MSLNYIHPNFEKRTKYFALFHATNSISVPFLDKAKEISFFDVYFSPILPKHFSSRVFECFLKNVFWLWLWSWFLSYVIILSQKRLRLTNQDYRIKSQTFAFTNNPRVTWWFVSHNIFNNEGSIFQCFN